MFDQNDWRFSRSRAKSEDFLKGAIDIHVHAGPHLFSSPRSTNPIQAAIDARDAGMRAICFMDVFNFTVGTSWIVSQAVPDFETYGGIILNTVNGGMNPRAVKTAIYYGSGARFVSFGAHSTVFQATKEGRYVDGKWRLLTEMYPEFLEDEVSRCIEIPAGKPSRQLDQILGLIADNPQIYLVTGHVGNDEALRLCDYAQEYGIKKVLVSNAVVENMSEAELEAAMKKGAILEKCLAAHTHTTPIPKTHYYVEPEYRAMDEGLQGTTGRGVAGVAEQIQKFGAENFLISSDFGVYTLPKPHEGFREFIACLMDCGLTDDEIRTVSSKNPARLLGIDLNAE